MDLSKLTLGPKVVIGAGGLFAYNATASVSLATFVLVRVCR